MHIFYTPDIDFDSEYHTLNKEESKHCNKVLRLKEGDKIKLTNGTGTFFEAQINTTSTTNTELKIIEKIQINTSNYSLSIAIAPTKNIKRFEFFLEKVAEIGIDKIIPLTTQFSERKIIKPERLEKVIISAIKQSEKAYKPELFELTKFEDIIKFDFFGKKIIAHCYDLPKTLLQETIKAGENILILIGPEGDFSEEEVQQAINSGFIPVSLSQSRLRTETAGIVACNTVALINLK